jgi:hypothetical protein
MVGVAPSTGRCSQSNESTCATLPTCGSLLTHMPVVIMWEVQVTCVKTVVNLWSHCPVLGWLCVLSNHTHSGQQEHPIIYYIIALQIPTSRTYTYVYRKWYFWKFYILCMYYRMWEFAQCALSPTKLRLALYPSSLMYVCIALCSSSPSPSW